MPGPIYGQHFSVRVPEIQARDFDAQARAAGLRRSELHCRWFRWLIPGLGRSAWRRGIDGDGVWIAATGTGHRDQHGLQCGRAKQNAAGGKHEKGQFRSVSLGHGRRGWCCTLANGTRYAESGLPESRTPANARFVFWTRSLHASALSPTLLAALLASTIALRHCCRIVTKSTAKCGAFDPRFFASWRA